MGLKERYQTSAQARLGTTLADVLSGKTTPSRSTFAELRSYGGRNIPETALRAITIPQLQRVYAHVQERCVSEGWVGKRLDTRGNPYWIRLSPETVNLYDLNTLVIRPATAEWECSMVELLAAEAAPPDWFVSHVPVSELKSI